MDLEESFAEVLACLGVIVGIPLGAHVLNIGQNWFGVGPNVAQQEFVPELVSYLSLTGTVFFHLLVADPKAVGNVEEVLEDTMKAFPSEVVVEVLKEFSLSKVIVEVRFFPLIDASVPPIHVLRSCHGVLGADDEINPFVVAGAEVGVELNIWEITPVEIVRMILTVGLLMCKASVAKCG